MEPKKKPSKKRWNRDKAWLDIIAFVKTVKGSNPSAAATIVKKLNEFWDKDGQEGWNESMSAQMEIMVVDAKGRKVLLTNLKKRV